MRMLLALVLLVELSACFAAPPVEVWPVDSMDNVFPDDAPGTHRAAEQAWLAPRNGHASVQFAVRATAPVADLNVRATLSGGLEVQVRHVGYVAVGSNPPNTPYDELVRPAPGLFPDPLVEAFPYALGANRTEAIWLTVRAPADAKPGVYRGTVVFESGKTNLATASFQVRVVEAAVPAARTLRVTNWLTTPESYLDRYYKLGGNSERYWQVVENIGRVMADHGQNVILTPVLELATPRLEGGKLVYDFSRLDRWVETFVRAGVVGTIEGGHLLSRVSGYNTPLAIPAYVIEDGKPVARQLEAGDPRAEQFFDSFLPALYAHLKERGWADRYIQHIHDEPHGAETAVYQRYGKIIRRNLPGVPTLDAIDLAQDLSFLDVTDIWVPVLSTFDHRMDTIREHVAKGGQAWFYTCIGPQGRYLNRFIDLPLLKTRLLHWMNFRYGFTGFLHWGGNYWGPEPMSVVQLVINDNETLLPAGDNAIVYPNPEKNSVLSSIRLEAMREGIEEYELLAALATKDPQKAQRLAAEAIPHFNDYVRDAAAFRRLQAQLLGVAPPAPAMRRAQAVRAPLPASAELTYWPVDSLTKVFPSDAPGAKRLVDATLDAARNSYTSLQIALRADGRALGDVYVDALPLSGPGIPIDSTEVRVVEYVVVTKNTEETPREELEAPAPGLFPDALSSVFPLTLERGKTRSVWVTVKVPPDQAPGQYRGELRVRQGADEIGRVPYTVTVHAAAVPARIPLAITNHFTFNDHLTRELFGVRQDSEGWWQLVGNVARFMGRYHQSSIVTDPVRMVKARVEDGELRFDFSAYERYVSAFQDAGVDQFIEGGNLLDRERRRGAPIMLRAWVNEGGKAVLERLPYQDPRARRFLDAYLPVLRGLLERRGWSKKYLQGVLDEPHPGEHEAFAEIAALVRKQLPGVRMLEPVGARQDLSFMKDVDIWTLQLGTFDDQRLAELRRHTESGGELWLYTALDPVGAYPNRFIDFSLNKVRILHWMNYRYGFRGFLHWGGNYWGPEPMLDTQPVINEGRTYLPPGDAYIVYPDRAERSLRSSIRLEQMREGIEDFALLDALAAKDRAAADVLAREAVSSFTQYVRDAPGFRRIHRKLLEAAGRALAGARAAE